MECGVAMSDNHGAKPAGTASVLYIFARCAGKEVIACKKVTVRPLGGVVTIGGQGFFLGGGTIFFGYYIQNQGYCYIRVSKNLFGYRGPIFQLQG